MIPNFLAVIFLVGGLQGLALTGALLRLRKQNSAMKYLIVMIGLLSVDTLSQLIYWQDVYLKVPHLLGVNMYLAAFYGPLFYLYVRQLVRPGAAWSWRNLYMFSFVVVCYALNAHVFALNADEKIALVQEISMSNMPLSFQIASGLMLSTVVFVISAAILLRKSRLAGIRNPWIDWVWIMTLFQGVIWIVVAINLATPFGHYFNGVPYILVSIMIYVLGYKALFAERPKQALPENQREKYGDQRLDNQLQQGVWAQIEKTLTDERLYTNPDLRVADLAAKTGMQVHLLSQVINETQGKNFNELINERRIEESQRLLKKDLSMSVQPVMEASGFQAKSTFNTLFKQKTGLTPSAYRKNAP